MNLKRQKSLLSALLVWVCVAGAEAQNEQVSAKQDVQAKEVNAGWASFEIELRDIVTDQLIAGNVDYIGELADSYARVDSRFIVLEVNAEGYLGGREHLFVVSPQRKASYEFVIYMHKPLEPARVQHVAAID
ncbi:MAG: hypothetical protein AAGA85_02390 [Bacteroidota bacterium]